MTEQILKQYETVHVLDTIHLGGMDVAGIPPSLKKVIAHQVLELLEPYVVAGHMIKQTVNGLVDYMQKGLATVMLTQNHEVLGFAKLYAYPSENDSDPPKGYEFSTWLSKYPKNGIGDQILADSVKTFVDQDNPEADFFAVCSSANMTPQIKLLAAGGIIIPPPFYVPNKLEEQTGAPHQETCINLKPLLVKRNI